jgi:hypothetical protein
MAHIQPSDFTALGFSDARASEVETLRYLQKNLPNEYTVFHSVHWASELSRTTEYGEIDFVVVNRAGEILVIEQKDGWLEETPEGLVKHYGKHRKNVASQVQRGIDRMRKKFSRQYGRKPGLNINYLIYCPDYRVLDARGAGIDMSRTIDASSKGDLAHRVQHLLTPGRHGEDAWRERVEAFFASSLRIVPDISSYVSSQERVYTQTVEGLGDVISKVEFSPFRLRVVGTAGCGKSQLTLRFCNEALAKGGKPLLLCFNNPLARRLAAAAHPAVTVNTYNGFCTGYLESLGVNVDFSRVREPGFWNDVQEQVVAAEIPDAAKFDYLAVDEGQDFDQEWFDILQLFLTEQASVLWLEDPMQSLFMKKNIRMPGYVTYRESANFRTPRSIAEFVKDALDVDFENRNPLPGLGVTLHAYKEPEEQMKMVAHQVSELLREGFRQEQIVILSCKGMEANAFADCEQIGAVRLKKFTGSYDAQGQQVYTDGDVYFDTIFRFKGQQAPAVILIDVDGSLRQDERVRNVLYCGMTRATVKLEILAQEGSPWSRQLQAAQ